MYLLKQKFHIFLHPDYHQFHISGLVTRRFTFGSGIWTITLRCSRRRSSTCGCRRRRWSTRPSPSSRWVTPGVTGDPGEEETQLTAASQSWSQSVQRRQTPSLSSDTLTLTLTLSLFRGDRLPPSQVTRIQMFHSPPTTVTDVRVAMEHVSLVWRSPGTPPAPFLFPFYILKAVCKVVWYQLDGNL